MLPEMRATKHSRLFVLFLLFSLPFLVGQMAYAQPHVDVIVTPLVVTGQAIFINSPPTAVFGINAYPNPDDPPGASATIQKLTVYVRDNDPGTGDSITPDDFAAIELYQDNGTLDGVFDPEDTPRYQQLPPFDPPPDPQPYDPDDIMFSVIFNTNFSVPGDDLDGNAGDDIFVVIRTSGTAAAEDDFFLTVPEDGIRITIDTVPATTETHPAFDEDTFLLTVVESPTANVTVTQLVGANQAILPRSGATEVFGINAVGSEEEPFELSSITVRVDDVGEFFEDGLFEVTASDFLVFQVYRDGPSEPSGRNGVFDPPGGTSSVSDTLIAEVAMEEIFTSPETVYTPFYVTIPIDSPDAALPDSDADAFAGNDFFVVLRTSDSIDSDFYIEDISQVDDFTVTIEPLSISVVGPVTGELRFPPEDAAEITSGAITTEALALDLWPVPMDRSVYESQFGRYPGHADDRPNDSSRYHYMILGTNLRQRFVGERDREFTGVSQNTLEGVVFSPFEQPVLAILERRQEVLGLDIAGGTANNRERLHGITLTLSNVGETFESLREFDPSFGLDPLRSTTEYRSFSGIAVYPDANNDGVFTEGESEPLAFFVQVIPGGSGPYPYNSNFADSHYMLQLEFTNRPELEVEFDEKPDFFIVMRPDSGKADDSGLVGDGTSINFGADFKISLESAEDINGDGLIDREDFNADSLPQTAPVRFRFADPLDGLTILADNSTAPEFRGVRELEAVISGQDLSLDFGCDCPNDGTARIQQRIDATSAPTALIGINAATSDIPELNLVDEPITLTELRLDFSGDGFEPSDIAEILLVRDDKSPFLNTGSRSIGVFDMFNDLWNLPRPGGDFGEPTNPDEDSPIAVEDWDWQNDGVVDYLRLYPKIPPRIYPHDDPESDASIDNFADNFEMIQSPVQPSISIPRDTVFSGADYFIAVRTSDTISYDDEIRVEIPRGSVAFSNGLTVFDGVDLFNPENRYSNIRSLRANVPVELNDLVQPGQEIGANSDFTPVNGLNMYTNRAPAAEGGIDAFFEQLVIAFLQHGTRDSLNLASDLLPFENVNGSNTANSGIQLYRDASGTGRNGVFDPGIDPLVPMDITPLLGPNPSRVGLAGDEANQVLMVFSSPENRQLVPPNDAGEFEGDDFFLVIRTSSTFNPTEDNFSAAIISWGPDSPAAPAPHTIDAKGNRPYDAISNLQAFPWGRRGIGFVDSNGIRTRATETINSNVFNATVTTWLTAVEDFEGVISPEAGVTDPTRQARLQWVDTNSDMPETPYFNENESGYWIESDMFGDFQPLPQNPFSADLEQFLFDGPAILAGKTVTFKIFPFRNNVAPNVLYPPFNGPGPAAYTSVTFWSSAVNPPPLANFETDPPGGGCLGEAVQFIDLSEHDPTSWFWDFGDGSTSEEQSPSHTYAGVGTYTVCLTVGNTSGWDTICKPIVINTLGAEFTSDVVDGFAPLTVQFMDQSFCDPATWFWEFGDGETSTGQNPSRIYATPGTYTVSLTVTGAGATDTETKIEYITVQEQAPVADFDTDPTGGGCVGDAVQFVDLSANSPTSWQWDFGDGATSEQQNPSHTYAEAGAYTVCLTVSNGMGEDTTCKEIEIEIVTADFTADVTGGCASLTVQFTDQSLCDPTTWFWEFGDGETSAAQNPSHMYSQAGTYTVSLTVTGGGGTDTETKTDYITVRETPAANFVASPTSGVAPLEVSFTDTSTGEPDSWEWDFGDGSPISNEQNPTHIFQEVGVYQVCLVVSNSCGSHIHCAEISAETEPTIALNLTSLANSAPLGNDAPSQSFEVWNSGGGTLAYSVSDNAIWLSVTPTSGTSTGEHDPIMVNYNTSGLGIGTYNARIEVQDPNALNTPQNIQVSLKVTAVGDLTEIHLVSPPNGSELTFAPTFTWIANGGSRNAYALDVSLSPDFTPFWSTYEHLGMPLFGTSFTMPATIWDQLPAGMTVYWRVRGVDLDSAPQAIVFSTETWSFRKE